MHKGTTILQEEAAILAARAALLAGCRDWRLVSTEAYLRSLENLALFAPQPLEAPLELNLQAARKRLAARARYLARVGVIAEIQEIKFAPSEEAAGHVDTGAASGTPTDVDARAASVRIWRRVQLTGAKPELLTVEQAVAKFKDESPAAELSPSVAAYVEQQLRAGHPMSNWYSSYWADQPEPPQQEPILS